MQMKGRLDFSASATAFAAALMVCTLTFSFPSTAALAQEAETVPPAVTLLISGGYWEDPGTANSTGIVKSPGVIDASKDGTRRGYYRLYALRQPDRTAKVFLSQISVTDQGSQIIDTVELQEITDLHAYVTDIRSEDPSGVNRGFGLSATVYLKQDARSNDPESWTVVVDEFGEIQVERESH
ncbi:hypothetical protein GOZ94_20005 [Agrobacterium vitis]|uniref:hypothetical protein n=1 Tax=Agrobacterium vitis TaxID=373 RepID=UPI0012E879ED|nr:hypothetical protein [Agrobacterium vitis]MVA21230.1 hypothetical protein [Agrobacterium vitis]